MSVYTEIILDHYQNPRNFGRLKKFTHQGQGANPLCGDKISIQAFIKDEKIIDIKFYASGCAISLASASMLSTYVKGKTKKELKKIDKKFIINMLRVNLGVNRIKCALLPLEVLQKTIYGGE